MTWAGGCVGHPLLVAEDLLDARMGDASSLSNGAVRVVEHDRLSDALPPRLLGLGPVDGQASKDGQAPLVAHLERVEVAEHPHVGSDDVGGAEAGVAVRPRLTKGLAGLGGESFALRLGHAVEVIRSGHTARILASGGVVKW
jgi:hypothetical protein